MKTSSLYKVLRPLIARQMASSFAFGCRVYWIGTYHLSNNLESSLMFTDEAYDTDGCFDSGASLTNIYARRPGYYIAGGSYSLPVAAATKWRHWVGVKANGTTLLGASEVHVNGDAGAYSTVAIATGMFYLAADEYINLRAYQNSGGTLDVVTASAAAQSNCCAWLMRVG